MPVFPAVSLRDALTQLFLLRGVEIIEVDAVEQALLDDLAQYFLLNALPL